MKEPFQKRIDRKAMTRKGDRLIQFSTPVAIGMGATLLSVALGMEMAAEPGR